VKRWTNTRVTLNDSWGPGAAHSLKTPVGRQPDFALTPRYLRGPGGARQLAHFTIDFPSGYLADGWQGVNFIPLGSREVKGIKGLPPWKAANRARYKKVIEGAAESLSDSRTRRLEAVVPYVGSRGNVGYNKIRLFYVSNAVRGQDRHLVIVKVVTHVGSKGEVQGRQDGSGHGPPH
jgi:hypothetical protein